MGDGSGAQPITTDFPESQQVCTTIEVSNTKGVGDDSSMKKKHIIACKEIKKAQ